MHTRPWSKVAAAGLLIFVTAAHARGQTSPSQGASEETAPRLIGTTGTMTIGVSGYVDRFFSSERQLPTNYTAQVEVTRFLTGKIVARGGLAGAGSFGGENSDDLPTGSEALALHGFGGVLYYFTPQSIVSAFAGVDYWTQLTRRAEADAGTIVATLGLEGAMSSRVSAFMEGSYGTALTPGEDDERVWRFIGRVGVRLKF